uniref:C2H2-type domain-containing protein n=1 Tax=Plectus sambesii TaxID=2011161 RepID=A0A914UT75_9BILA
MIEEPSDVRPSSDELLAVGATVCNICDASFPHTSARQLHMVKSHRIIKDHKDYSLFHRSKSQAVYRFFCPEKTCAYFDRSWFKSLAALKQHYQKCHLPKTLKCQFCPQVRFSLHRDRNYHEKICPLRPKSSEVPSTSLDNQDAILMDIGRNNDVSKNDNDVVDVEVVVESRTEFRKSMTSEEKRLSSAEQSKLDQSAVKARRGGKFKVTSSDADISREGANPNRPPIVFVCINSPRAI